MPWEGVFHCLNLHEDMLKYSQGWINIWHQPACEWWQRPANSAKNLSVWSSNTPKAWVCKTKSSNTCKRSHMKDHFYFLTWSFNTNRPCLDILLTRNVWQFEKLEHLPIHHLGRWHSPQRSLRNQNPKFGFQVHFYQLMNSRCSESLSRAPR